MIAAVYHGPNDLRLESRPTPPITVDEVLLRVASASICGTDLRIVQGGHRMYPPGTVRIPGHEMAGTIAAVGARVEGIHPGHPVFVAPNIGCEHCRHCLAGNGNLCENLQAIGITMDGAFADYVRVPEAALRQGCVISLGTEADLSVAPLIEPLACVLRGQDSISVGKEDTLLILGAGPIGIMHMLVARTRGVSRILMSEVSPGRMALARALGADLVIDPLKDELARVVADETQGKGVDATIVAASVPELQECAPSLTRVGGRICFFGGLPSDRPFIRLDSNLVHYKELVITGTTGSSTQDCRRAAELFTSGRIPLGRLVGARFPLAQADEAFIAARDRQSLKVMLDPMGSSE